MEAAHAAITALMTPSEGMVRAGFRVNVFENKHGDKRGCPGIECAIPVPEAWDAEHAEQINAYISAPKCLVARATIDPQPAFQAMLEHVLNAK
jgi:hypothetical protein